MESLEREEHIAPPAPDPQAIFDGAKVLGQLEDIDSSLDPEIKELISRCMEGTEVLDRPLKTWENQKFNAINVTTVLLKAAGFKGGQVADILGIDQGRVSVSCNHPYGRKIIQAMMHRRGAKVIDIKTRLEEYAGELLDKLHKDAMAANDLKIVAAVGFGLLDRAGYGVTQKIESKSLSVSAVATPENINRLTDALDGSNLVDSHIMPNFSVKPPPDTDGHSIGTAETRALPQPVRRVEPGDG